MLAVVGALAGCGEQGSEPVMPYSLGQAMVIGESKGGKLQKVDESCDTDACNAVLERCGADSFADVVLSEHSEVLDVLCYRPNLTVREIGDEPVDTVSVGNNTVLVFDGEDDELDVTGDVVIEGNNVIIYGEGADVSVIGGGLDIDKNNAMLRGLRIKGDVTITKNNAKLAFCEIEGNLDVTGNNTTLAECVVHGEINIEGNNTVLVQNQIADESPIFGKNARCNANVAFDDADSDFVVDDGELGDEVVCGRTE